MINDLQFALTLHEALERYINALNSKDFNEERDALREARELYHE